MTLLECPLCCAERFSDVCSLESHLLDLCENIVCPLCELQFKTIKTLAWHLGQECKNLSKQSDTENPEVFNHPDNKKSPVIYEEKLLETADVKTGEVDEKLIKSEDITTNDDMGNSMSEEIVVVEDASYGINEYPDPLENESNTVCEESIEENLDYSASLYSCSVCNITFSSVKDHLNEFHRDENVLVDHNVNEYANEMTNENSIDDKGNVVLEEKVENSDYLRTETNSEYLTQETISPIWTQDEISNIMIVNWDSKVECLIKSGDNVIENQVLERLHSNDKIQWIFTPRGYYISNDGQFESSNKIKNTLKEGESVINTVRCSRDEEWPESLRKYPLATFVICDEFISNRNMSYSFENKSYLFNEHRVRLLKIYKNEGPPKIEDIPFPEEPPDCIIPTLERADNVPKELAGSYAVMWPCHLCGALAYHWSDLAKHCCSSSTKCYPCTLCKKSFTTRRSLNNHYSVIHKIIRPLNGCFPCPLCPAKVQTSSHLEKHLAMHKKNDLVKCDLCENMVQKSTYSDHLKAHGKNGSLNLVCQLCNRPFKGESELKLHIPQCHLKSNEQDNLKCQNCKLDFEELKALREHMVSHGIPIKPHLCSFCPKSYNRLIDKVIHERVHTKSKPHSCNECGRCFRLKHSLIAHMRIHTGERPFKCSYCIRTFRTKHLQRSHIATHSGLYQYKCKYCNKQFRSKDKVEVHENSHKKPFVCAECKRTFYSLGFAKKHMENHKNGQLKYPCNMCPNMFTRAAYLETHLSTKHGLDKPTSISISTQKTYEQMEGSLYQ